MSKNGDESIENLSLPVLLLIAGVVIGWQMASYLLPIIGGWVIVVSIILALSAYSSFTASEVGGCVQKVCRGASSMAMVASAGSLACQANQVFQQAHSLQDYLFICVLVVVGLATFLCGFVFMLAVISDNSH